MFSVELVLDPETESTVREDWDRLLAADLPSAGRNPAPSNRPHVTLAVRDDLEPSVFTGVADLLPVTLELGGTLLLGHRDRFILTRHIVVNRALLDVHLAVADLAGPPEPRYSNTLPDRWTPHVTLARGLTATRLATALRLISHRHVVGEATGLRVWNAEERIVTTLR
ncbi:2'-5' RNA ligase family protein [Microbacterium sp.]|uniref:2'-5' RNA ligase family protein n=1 Tax=Microbacterium sp. TaxID=51671 RepID=UPI002D77937F|nr:2'-5' RNA ligase family protein [Microbacterium sp.]HET6300412.1 2'-5' RNA ligase family protein [Microbacterium sp.]